MFIQFYYIFSKRSVFKYSEATAFFMQNEAFDAFLQRYLIASVNEPDGLKMLPRY